jgi:hypothetical protein
MSADAHCAGRIFVCAARKPPSVARSKLAPFSSCYSRNSRSRIGIVAIAIAAVIIAAVAVRIVVIARMGGRAGDAGAPNP